MLKWRPTYSEFRRIVKGNTPEKTPQIPCGSALLPGRDRPPPGCSPLPPAHIGTFPGYRQMQNLTASHPPPHAPTIFSRPWRTPRVALRVSTTRRLAPTIWS